MLATKDKETSILRLKGVKHASLKELNFFILSSVKMNFILLDFCGF